MIDFNTLPACWKEQLKDFLSSDSAASLVDFLKQEQSDNATLYPDPSYVFRAFDLTRFNDVKVVILGQDPYHQQGQAEGLCFSVSDETPKPPSLKNIFKELTADLDVEEPKNHSLVSWAKSGVLLLNSTLTVRHGQPGSHSDKGWEIFTDLVINKLSINKELLVFVLWGSYARKKKYLIDIKRHLVIESAHPSPLSAYRGFFGSRPFSQINQYLEKNSVTPISWDLNENCY